MTLKIYLYNIFDPKNVTNKMFSKSLINNKKSDNDNDEYK